jgi:rhomboid protease GluP
VMNERALTLMDGLLAWEPHLGGFVAGWATAFLLDPAAS